MFKIIKSVATICLFFFVLTIFSSIALAEDSATISETDAKKAAIFQLLLDSACFEYSPWHNEKIKIEEPIEVYDTSANLYSYLFNLNIDGNNAGFIETSALTDKFPIISFSYDESNMTSSDLKK